MLGADIPEEFGGKAGFPVTVWEDNFEAIGQPYARHSAKFVAGLDKILHFCFSALNRTPDKYTVTEHICATREQ